MTDSPRRRQRHWVPEARAEVLAVLIANGGNVSKTARETGAPGATIRMWRDAPEKAAPAEVRERARKELADEVDEVRWLYLDRARDPNAVRTTSGFYAVQAFQKLTEAHQLLTGKPTQRIEATPWGQLLTEIRDRRHTALPVVSGANVEPTEKARPN